MPDNFEFAYFWVFYLLPLPLLVIWVLPAVRIRKKSLKVPFLSRVAELSGQQPKRGVRQLKRPWIRQVVLWVLWALVLTTLARPQLVGEPDMVVKTSRNFLMVADISFSMAQEDWELDDEKVSRWEAVKHLMGEFINEREGDRMGILLFGSNAYTLAPFTSDSHALLQLLDDTDVGMAGQQTNIGRAIGKSIELFANDTLPNKVLLLLTDGADSGIGVSPFDAAELAGTDSITIHTIGIGDPDKPSADLDEEALQHISKLTGGQYFLAKDAGEMEKVFEVLEEIEPVEYEYETYVPVQELYFYPLAALFAFSFITNLGIYLASLYRRNPETDKVGNRSNSTQEMH